MYQVIESKTWKSNTGRTASIYGALPYLSEQQKQAEGWEIVSDGWTVNNLQDNTIGACRVPWKTQEEAQQWADAENARIVGAAPNANGQWLVIRKLAYLRTPSYTVTCSNADGGSFSNSCQRKSLKDAARHIYHSYRYILDQNPSAAVVIETIHGDDADGKEVVTTETTDIDAFLSRTGVTR